MPGEIVDRRIQKTLKLLQNALAELIAEKDYEDITIQDILDRANVGRSTFYAHFENKDQLLRSMLTLLNDKFEEGIQHISDGHKPYEANSDNMPLKALQFIEQNQRLFKALLGKPNQSLHSNPLSDYLFVIIREHFLSMLRLRNADPLQAEMIARYYTGAFIGALAWWVENDLVYPPEVFAQMLNRLILPGLNAAFS